MAFHNKTEHYTFVKRYAFVKHYAIELLWLGFPILLAQLAKTGLNFIDTAIAGKAGTAQMAGVSLGDSVWTPLLLFAQGLLIPIGPLVAQKVGASLKDSDKEEEVNALLQQGIWLALFASIVLIFVLSLASKLYFNAKNIDSDMAQVASEYLYYIKWGLPAFLLLYTCRFFIESKCFTKPAMIAGFVGLLVYYPINAGFVLGHYGLPAMGGAGCGVATAITYWLMFFIVLFYVKKHSPYSLRFSLPKWRIQKQFCLLGLPVAFTLLIEFSSFFQIANIVAPLSKKVVSAHQIAMTVSGVFFMFPYALGSASTILIGRAIGAKDMQKAQYLRKVAVLLSIFIALCSICVLVIFRTELAKFYIQDSTVINLASTLMLITALYKIQDNIQLVLRSCLRAYNDMNFLFFVSCLCYWGISIPLGYVLCYTNYIIEPIGIYGFWTGFVIGFSISALLLYLRVLYLEKNYNV